MQVCFYHKKRENAHITQAAQYAAFLQKPAIRISRHTTKQLCNETAGGEPLTEN
jgi:hypothetical protein